MQAVQWTRIFALSIIKYGIAKKQKKCVISGGCISVAILKHQKLVMVFNCPSLLRRVMFLKEAWEVSSENIVLFKSYHFLRNKKRILRKTKVFQTCHIRHWKTSRSFFFFSGLFFVRRWLALGVLQVSSVPAVASYCGVVARIDTSLPQDLQRATISIVEVTYTIV